MVVKKRLIEFSKLKCGHGSQMIESSNISTISFNTSNGTRMIIFKALTVAVCQMP